MNGTAGFKRAAREALRRNFKAALFAAVLLVVAQYLLELAGTSASGISAFYNSVSEKYNDIIKQYGAYPFFGTDASRADMNAFLSALPDLLQSCIRPLGVVLFLLLSIAESVLLSGAAWFWLRLSRGESLKARRVFDSFRSFTRIFGIIILAGIFTALWSLLFIIPGIIATYRYSQAIFIALDDPDMSALQCIRESKRLMRGHKGFYFILTLSFIGWLFIDSLVRIYIGLPLVQLFLIPYLGLTKAAFYTRIKNNSYVTQQENPTRKE